MRAYGNFITDILNSRSPLSVTNGSELKCCLYKVLPLPAIIRRYKTTRDLLYMCY
jgi:hypothetical protein